MIDEAPETGPAARLVDSDVLRQLCVHSRAFVLREDGNDTDGRSRDNSRCRLRPGTTDFVLSTQEPQMVGDDAVPTSRRHGASAASTEARGKASAVQPWRSRRGRCTRPREEHRGRGACSQTCFAQAQERPHHELVAIVAGAPGDRFYFAFSSLGVCTP
jgi:hypothetical protein